MGIESKEDLGADGSNSGIEAEGSVEEQDPFNPKDISIDAKIVSMDAIIRRLEQKTIRLAPDFQRNEIWNDERKSQLIESLLLKIPLPMFYVAADTNGSWDVVDGLQRLTTIKEFILGSEYIKTKNDKFRGNGFKLNKLEFWTEYEKKTFNDLPENLKNRILETEFKFTVINPGTPKEVKFNIFKRINTGGMPLTQQEIRHALYQGKATKLLKKLVEIDIFKEATCNSIDDSRMGGRELILRFIAFSIFRYEDYPRSNNMNDFLNNIMILINKSFDKASVADIFPENKVKLLADNIKTLETRFKSAMYRAKNLFQKHAFRGSLSRGDRRSPINKTLFETWGNILADLDEKSFKTLRKNKKQLISEHQKLWRNPKFLNNVARYAWKHSAVQHRYKALNELVDKFSK